MPLKKIETNFIIQGPQSIEAIVERKLITSGCIEELA